MTYLSEGEVQPSFWHLRLYIAGMTPTAERALANVKAICDMHLKDRHRLDVVDLLKEPELAVTEQILAVPTLVREQPTPKRKIVGDLSHGDRALAGLGILRT